MDVPYCANADAVGAVFDRSGQDSLANVPSARLALHVLTMGGGLP
jgi:hypothetical protein